MINVPFPKRHRTSTETKRIGRFRRRRGVVLRVVVRRKAFLLFLCVCVCISRRGDDVAKKVATTAIKIDVLIRRKKQKLKRKRRREIGIKKLRLKSYVHKRNV